MFTLSKHAFAAAEKKVEFFFLFSISVITHQLGSARRVISHSAHTEPCRRRLPFFHFHELLPSRIHFELREKSHNERSFIEFHLSAS